MERKIAIETAKDAQPGTAQYELLLAAQNRYKEFNFCKTCKKLSPGYVCTCGASTVTVFPVGAAW